MSHPAPPQLQCVLATQAEAVPGTAPDMALVRPEALDESRIEDLIGQHLAHNLEILPEQAGAAGQLMD